MLLRIDKKNPQIILLVGVALFIPLLGAYMMFDSLREADFLSSGIKYEESDIGDLLADKQVWNLAASVPPAIPSNPTISFWNLSPFVVDFPRSVRCRRGFLAGI
jgi:hypothetical protein